MRMVSTSQPSFWKLARAPRSMLAASLSSAAECSRSILMKAVMARTLGRVSLGGAGALDGACAARGSAARNRTSAITAGHPTPAFVLDRESPLRQTALRSASAMTRTLALAVAVALMRSDAPGAAPQARPTPPPTLAGDRVAIGPSDVGRYEVMYGSPESRTLDEDAVNWPLRTAIRTVGTLEPIPGRGQSGAASPPSSGLQGQGRVGLWDNPLARYRICGGRGGGLGMGA